MTESTILAAIAAVSTVLLALISAWRPRSTITTTSTSSRQPVVAKPNQA